MFGCTGPSLHSIVSHLVSVIWEKEPGSYLYHTVSDWPNRFFLLSSLVWFRGFRVLWLLPSTIMTRWPPSPWTPSLLLINSAVTCPVWLLERTVQRYSLFISIGFCVASWKPDFRALISLWVFGQVAEQLSKVQGVKKILIAQHASYKGSLPGKLEVLFKTLEVFGCCVN